MGGLIVLASALIPELLWESWTIHTSGCCSEPSFALGFVGFLDDYLKVVKKYKKGLSENIKSPVRSLSDSASGMSFTSRRSSHPCVKSPGSVL